MTELRYQYRLDSGKNVVLSIHKYNRLPLSNMLDQQSRDAELQCTGSARYGYLIRLSIHGAVDRLRANVTNVNILAVEKHVAALSV